MIPKKVTKKQLKGIILCDSERWEVLIDSHWSRWRWRIPMTEIVQKGQRLEASPENLLWIIFELDAGRLIKCQTHLSQYRHHIDKSENIKKKAIELYLAGGGR